MLRSAYIECVDETGVLEWNTASNTLVAFHQNVSGIMQMSPNNDHAFVIDADAGLVNVLTPNGEHFLILGGIACEPMMSKTSTGVSQKAAYRLHIACIQACPSLSQS